MRFLFITFFFYLFPITLHAQNVVNTSSIFETNHFLPLTYQPSSPSLPFYKYSTQLPNTGEFQLKIHFLDSIVYNDIEVNLSKGLEKQKGDFVDYDSSYFIEAFDSNSFFPQKDFISFQPVIGRNQRMQTFHIFPYKYKASTKELKVYTKFSVELVKTKSKGENEIITQRNPTKVENLYLTHSHLDDFNAKYLPIDEEGDLLIVYKNTSDTLIQRFAHWKSQTGITTHLLKLDHADSTSELIQQKIRAHYDSIPDILYLLLIGNENEIPPYLYKQHLNTDYYSDTYYGMLDGNDFVPELLVGRFSGTEEENRISINKTIAYEKYSLAQNYEQNLLLIGSDQGENIGNNGDLDWEHLRNIGIYLEDNTTMNPTELYDGSQGGLDEDGNPTPQDVKDALNAGQGFVFYTGHGEFTSFTTGSFFSMHVKQLENYHQLPVIISAACDNGKYMDGLNCLGEVFNTVTKNEQLTGSVAFMGSSILMSWAPPMQTQIEFSKLINPNNSNYQSRLGAAFYNAQLSMLENYPTTFGEEVMQTWILLGDPSLKLRVNQKGTIEVEHPFIVHSDETTFTFPVNENGALVTLSQNGQIIATAVSEENQVVFQNLNIQVEYPIEVVATKANYVTYVGEIHFVNSTTDNSSSKISIYPNPTKNQCFIESNEEIDSINVFNLEGKKMPSHFDFSTKILILYDVSEGIYFIQLISNHTIHTEKIQIRYD